MYLHCPARVSSPRLACRPQARNPIDISSRHGARNAPTVRTASGEQKWRAPVALQAPAECVAFAFAWWVPIHSQKGTNVAGSQNCHPAGCVQNSTPILQVAQGGGDTAGSAERCGNHAPYS